MDAAPGQGIQELLAALEAEAAEELARLDAESAVEAEAIVTAAREEAAAIEAERVRSQEPALEAEVAHRLAAARLDAARTLRDAGEASFQEAFARLRARLVTLRGDDVYPAIFRALLDEARAALPRAQRLVVDPRDEALAGRLTVGLEHPLEIELTLSSDGGIVLVEDDERLARNTVEERLANAEPELRAEVARLVAGLDKAGSKS